MLVEEKDRETTALQDKNSTKDMEILVTKLETVHLDANEKVKECVENLEKLEISEPKGEDKLKAKEHKEDENTITIGDGDDDPEKPVVIKIESESTPCAKKNDLSSRCRENSEADHTKNKSSCVGYYKKGPIDGQETMNADGTQYYFDNNTTSGQNPPNVGSGSSINRRHGKNSGSIDIIYHEEPRKFFRPTKGPVENIDSSYEFSPPPIDRPMNYNFGASSAAFAGNSQISNYNSSSGGQCIQPEVFHGGSHLFGTGMQTANIDPSVTHSYETEEKLNSLQELIDGLTNGDDPILPQMCSPDQTVPGQQFSSPDTGYGSTNGSSTSSDPTSPKSDYQMPSPPQYHPVPSPMMAPSPASPPNRDGQRAAANTLGWNEPLSSPLSDVFINSPSEYSNPPSNDSALAGLEDVLEVIGDQTTLEEKQKIQQIKDSLMKVEDTLYDHRLMQTLNDEQALSPPNNTMPVLPPVSTIVHKPPTTYAIVNPPAATIPPAMTTIIIPPSQVAPQPRNKRNGSGSKVPQQAAPPIGMMMVNDSTCVVFPPPQIPVTVAQTAAPKQLRKLAPKPPTTENSSNANVNITAPNSTERATFSMNQATHISRPQGNVPAASQTSSVPQFSQQSPSQTGHTANLPVSSLPSQPLPPAAAFSPSTGLPHKQLQRKSSSELMPPPPPPASHVQQCVSSNQHAAYMSPQPGFVPSGPPYSAAFVSKPSPPHPQQAQVSAPSQNPQRAKAYMTVSRLSPEKLLFVDDDGDGLLHLAMVQDEFLVEAIVNRAVREKTIGQIINQKNNLRQTPLYLAVHTNQPSLVRLLLQHGAEPNCEAIVKTSVEGGANNNRTMTPLHYCTSMLGQTGRETLAMLLNSPNIDVNANNSDGETALHIAVNQHGRRNRQNIVIDNKECIHHLLHRGALLQQGDKKSGRTPLHHLVEKRDTDLLHFVLNVAVQTNTQTTTPIREIINQKTYDGNTCLHLAAGQKLADVALHVQLVKMLLDFGADPTQKNLNNQTAKELVFSKRQEVIDILKGSSSKSRPSQSS